MANLEELAKIDRDSMLNPNDPANPLSPAAAAAVKLRDRVRMALIQKASSYIAMIYGRSPAGAEGQEELEQLAFAQQVLRNPDQHLPALFRMLVAQSPAAAEPAGILQATDQAINDALSSERLKALARGLSLGR